MWLSLFNGAKNLYDAVTSAKTATQGVVNALENDPSNGGVGDTANINISGSHYSPLASVLGSIGSGLLGLFGINSTNARNEALMRESWQREDTAVQRRVADLKAAGLSPTLAAGSAAASSGPVTMSNPLASFSDFGRSILDAANLNKSLSIADAQIKSMTVQNAMREKTIDKMESEISRLNKEIKYLGWLRVSQIARNWSSVATDVSRETRSWTRPYPDYKPYSYAESYGSHYKIHHPFRGDIFDKGNRHVLYDIDYDF